MSELIILPVCHGYSRQPMVWCVATGGENNAKHFGRFLLRQHHTQRTGHGPTFELKRATDRVARFENQLTEQLDEAGQTILAKLIESQQEIDSITAMENFILGFRLGVRMMAECMDENDGDIRNGG